MTSSTAIADLLGGTAIFEGLSASVLKDIAAAMRPVSYTAGQLIFSRNEPGASLYLVTSGRVRLSVASGEGRELTFRIAEAGEIMGEIAALDQGRAPRTPLR